MLPLLRLWLVHLATTATNDNPNSWEWFESRLPSSSTSSSTSSPPIARFYRDAEALDPVGQQIWMALECKKVPYEMVYTTDDAIKLEWLSDDQVMTDRLEILKSIQDRTSDVHPDLYERISAAVDNVSCNMVRFNSIYPRDTIPSLEAPYLYKEGDVKVPLSSIMVSLEEIEEVLEEYDDGPFLCGEQLTAADISWMPYLERYAAQLPMVYREGEAHIRNSIYECIDEWYQAMEETIPEYSCRVGGDAVSWRNILLRGVEEGKVPKNILLSNKVKPPKLQFTNAKKATKIWSEYVRDRPHLCPTPEEECVAYFVRNRRDLPEEPLREVLEALLASSSNDEIEQPTLSEDAQTLARNMNDDLRVPRDMGMIPAAALRRFVARMK